MPTRFQVSLGRKAQQDIEEIWSFIAKDSSDDATRFIQRLDEQVTTLESFPERCPLISENKLMHSRYRHLIYGKYRTIFRIAKRTVFVVRVIHSARLLTTTFFESVGDAKED
jgi:plasmid stabilization system protein ParE